MACRAAGFTISTSSGITSEEKLLTEEQSHIDLDEIYDQLEQLKLRAKRLRKLLIREQPMTAEYAKYLDAIEKNGSKNVEVRAVQLQTADLLGQMATLTHRLKDEKKHMNGLECYLQQNHKKTDNLYCRMNKLQTWPEKLNHQAGICLERFNDLNISCVDLVEFSPFIKRAYETYLNGTRLKTPFTCYQMDQRNVVKRLQAKWQSMHTSFQLMVKNSNDLELILRNYNRLRQLSLSDKSLSEGGDEEESMEKCSVSSSLRSITSFKCNE